MERVLGVVAHDERAEETRVLVQALDAHRVVVVPEHRGVLLRGVVADLRAPRRVPVLGVPVALGGHLRAVHVDDRAHLGLIVVGAVDRPVDGQEVTLRQVVDPFDEDPLPAARLDRRAGHRSAVGPDPRGRKVAVHAHRRFGHGDPVVRQPAGGVVRIGAGPVGREHARNGERIDEARELVGAEQGAHRRCGRRRRAAGAEAPFRRRGRRRSPAVLRRVRTRAAITEPKRKAARGEDRREPRAFGQ
jgi:hypothetical protein